MQCSILRCEVAKRLCSVQCCIKPCSTTRCSGMRMNATCKCKQPQSKVTQYTETKCKRNVSNGSEPMHCKEMQRADSNAVQSDAESGWNEVQDGARWCKMEPDRTGWDKFETFARSELIRQLTQLCRSRHGRTWAMSPQPLKKKWGSARSMESRWQLAEFQCVSMSQDVVKMSHPFNADFQCWPLQKIASLFLWFFWLQQLCCALKDSLRFQHWLLKARLAALMLGRTSTIIQFDDGIIEPYWTIENIWKLSSSAPLIPLSGDKAVPCVEQPVHSGPNCGPQFASVW